MNWDKFRKDLRAAVDWKIRFERGEFDHGPWPEVHLDPHVEIKKHYIKPKFELCQSYDDRQAWYQKYGAF